VNEIIETNFPSSEFAFTNISSPSGVNLNPATGILTWTPSSTGSFSFVMSAYDTNAPGFNATNSFVVDVRASDEVSPSVTIAPESQSAPIGDAVNFSVNAIGSAPLSYQWYFDGNLLFGATTSTYTIASVQATNGGSYSVTVTNVYGSTTASATLGVVTQLGTDSNMFVVYSNGIIPPPPAQLFTWSELNCLPIFDATNEDPSAPQGTMAFLSSGPSCAWFGWGIFSATDMGAYLGGQISFLLKSTTSLEVQLQDQQGQKGTVLTPSTGDQWQEMTYPLADFTTQGVDLTAIYGLFLITDTNGPTTFSVDNVVWNKAASGKALLVVQTVGTGGLSPNYNGQLLEIGKTYKMTAQPNGNQLFLNWSEQNSQQYSVLTNGPTLTFVMEAGLVLQANFIPSPFLCVKGTYNGLFTTADGVTQETGGMLKQLTIGPKGTYSGTLLINGGSYAISGAFDLAGYATNRVARSPIQGGPLLMEITLAGSSGSAPQVAGTVSGSAGGIPWTADLIAFLATNLWPSAEYTMLIPPDTSSGPPLNSPGGYGYAVITNYAGTFENPASASVRITGALADGTALNQTVSVSQNGFVPLYANLYADKGLLLGWISLNPANSNINTGSSLTWIRPAQGLGLYRGGFTNVIPVNQILLSTWINPSVNIASLTDLSLLSGINDNHELTTLITTTAAGKITGAAVNGTIDLKTGLLTVSIKDGQTTAIGHGAILLNPTRGGGYFLTRTNAQAITLTQ
jgi:hypothetical protein